MNQRENGSTGGFLTGFVLGSLAGAAAAVLLAPYSGQETRRQIREKTAELGNRADDILSEAQANVERVATKAKRQAEQVQIQSQVLLEEGQRQLKQAVDETKKAAGAAARRQAEEA